MLARTPVVLVRVAGAVRHMSLGVSRPTKRTHLKFLVIDGYARAGRTLTRPRIRATAPCPALPAPARDACCALHCRYTPAGRADLIKGGTLARVPHRLSFVWLHFPPYATPTGATEAGLLWERFLAKATPPGVSCEADIVHPSDPGYSQSSVDFSQYSGVAWTGSSLSTANPATLKAQIETCRTLFGLRIPMFGRCGPCNSDSPFGGCA